MAKLACFNCLQSNCRVSQWKLPKYQTNIYKSLEIWKQSQKSSGKILTNHINLAELSREDLCQILSAESVSANHPATAPTVQAFGYADDGDASPELFADIGFITDSSLCRQLNANRIVACSQNAPLTYQPLQQLILSLKFIPFPTASNCASMLSPAFERWFATSATMQC